MKNQTGVNVRQMMEVAKIKVSILDKVDVLLNDEIISREEVAADLLVLVDRVVALEGDIHKQMIANDYRAVYNLAEQKELEREQKETSTVRE